MLAYTGAVFLDDRTDLVDGDADELFSDVTLVRLFNEAEKRLCRRAWVLIDDGGVTGAANAANSLILKTDVTGYRLHRSVLYVYKARIDGDVYPLPRSTDARLDGYQAVDPDAPFDVNVTTALAAGKPMAFATDAGTRWLRLLRAPSATYSGTKLFLKVARMPSNQLSVDKPDQCPEVDEQWHESVLCKYAAGKCLTMSNVDGTAKTEGRRLLEEVETAIREARQERERLESAPPQYRFASTTAME